MADYEITNPGVMDAFRQVFGSLCKGARHITVKGAPTDRLMEDIVCHLEKQQRKKALREAYKEAVHEVHHAQEHVTVLSALLKDAQMNLDKARKHCAEKEIALGECFQVPEPKRKAEEQRKRRNRRRRNRRRYKKV